MLKINIKSYLYVSSYIIVIFPIITLIFSVTYTNTPYLTGFLQELSNSLNDYPLTDLEYIYSCPNEKYALTIFTIPESVQGCACLNLTYEYKQTNKEIVFRGKCSKNNTLNGCISISNYSSVDLKIWHSKIFCCKRYSDETSGYKKYFKNSVLKGENCSEGYKKCGKLDDMDNYLCLPIDEPCPVNDIKVLDQKDDNLTDYTFYQIGDKYLYFTNTSTENPLITKLKTFEGKLCHGKGYYHTDYPQFILDNNFEKYGCRYEIQDTLYDESIEKLDIITKDELYKDNGIHMFSRYNNSCEYPYFSLNADIFLYSKRYIGFNKQCLKENNLNIDDKIFKHEIINIINESLLKNRTQHSILIWISIAAIDFYLMTCFFIDIDEDNTFLNFYIWSAITLPFYLAMNIIAIIGLAAISNVKRYPLCNDEMTNLKIELFNNKSRIMFLNTLALFIIINGQLALTIILYFLKRRKILRNTNTIDDSHSSNIMETISKFSQDSPIMTERSNKSE